MKKIVLLCVFIIVAISGAEECEVRSYSSYDILYPSYLSQEKIYPIVAFDLRKNMTKLDVSRLSFLDIENYSSDNAVYGMYLAKSDATIMVFVFENSMFFLKICDLEETCYSLGLTFSIGNIMIEEFNRLQSAGVFTGTASEADSLIRHIVEVIENYTFIDQDLKNASMTGIVYNPFLKIEGDFATKALPTSYLCNDPEIDHNNVNVCAALDTVIQCRLQPQQKLSLIPTHTKVLPQGIYYRAFDTKGRFIEDGVWNDKKNHSSIPMILKFENGFTTTSVK